MQQLRSLFQRYRVWLAMALGALLIIAVVYALIGIRPPQQLTIATGRQGGAYYAFAEAYQSRLAELGYTLTIRETAGTIETIELLESGAVDAGFVQNTAIGSTPSSPLTTLAALYYEPLWIFYRDDLGIDPSRIVDLTGRRINIGEAGSAGNQAILGLLAMNNISSDNATLTTLPDSEAAQGLKDGDLDVIMFFLGAGAPLVTELATTPGIGIAPARRAAAYASRFKNLVKVTLPEGALDFAADVPPADISLLATRATLVAGPTLHPDLAQLLLIVAGEIHSHGGLFEAPGEFPAPTAVGIPMNADAERYLDSGSTFLERYVPLSLASRLERLFLLLLPIVVFAYPLMRGTLTLRHTYYSDRLKWRYRDLRVIDREYKSYDRVQLEETISVLTSQLDAMATDMSVPTTMLDDLYNLHYHTSLVLDRLTARLAELEEAT